MGRALWLERVVNRVVPILSYSVFSFVSFSYIAYNAVDNVFAIDGMAVGVLLSYLCASTFVALVVSQLVAVDRCLSRHGRCV